jgi:hypothetical protein
MALITESGSNPTHLVLDTRVFSFCVLTDQDSVDVVVCGLVALDGDTWTNVGEEGESTDWMSASPDARV